MALLVDISRAHPKPEGPKGPMGLYHNEGYGCKENRHAQWVLLYCYWRHLHLYRQTAQRRWQVQDLKMIVSKPNQRIGVALMHTNSAILMLMAMVMPSTP